ncbi:MAG: response regulator transcription factor [Lewinellaceae bacterium]|nr:response regulator transcription factor [Saprospiraceae bacterium]MCB9338395.1 response regulator transcription factor [Lewinellaceae bacterium]
MDKILVVEDEPSISNFIKKGLVENGYQVSQAFSAETGLQFLQNDSYAAIILDLILPGINGLEFCKKIRSDLRIHTPVLMLTALTATDDVVAGLDAGADDYLAKPFEFKELMARIRALARRQGGVRAPVNKLQVADLEMDLDQKKVVRAGQEIRLTPKEFFLLEYLMRNKHRVVSRLDILENVWDIQFDLGTNVVDVYMNYLRNKVDKPFEQKLIQTMVGMGYVMRE